jgi:hypothetical protein
MKKIILVLAWLVFVLTACAGTPTEPAAAQNGIEVYEPWMRAAGMHGANVTGAFLLLKNTGPADDRLVGARSEIAALVEIHETTMENGVMSMRAIEGIDLPAGGEAVLKPGGYHIMLINLKRELRDGEAISITLVFEQAGELEVAFPVRNP